MPTQLYPESSIINLLLNRNFSTLLSFRSSPSDLTRVPTAASTESQPQSIRSDLRSDPDVLATKAFTVFITAVEVRREDYKQFAVYKTLITCGAEQWWSFKRFSEFKELEQVIKRDKGDHVLAPFPSRKFFGNNLDPDFLNRRKQQLNAYIQSVLDVPRLRALPALRAFFADKTPAALFGEELLRAEQYDKNAKYATFKLKPSPFMDADSQTKSGNGLAARAIAARRRAGTARNMTKNGAKSRKKEGNVALDDFLLLKVIGKGSYGRVVLARNKETGRVYAVKAISKKELKKRPHEIQRIMAERTVLKQSIDHPFLIGLRYAFQSKSKLYFCVDYVNGGELFFHLQRERKFDEARVRFYTCEILSALEYLHSQQIVYRDLKPENCLLDASGHVRIVDFGLAKNLGKMRNQKTYTFCGTPEYLAPEVLRQQGYSFAVDWYCLGALVHEMLIGLPPYYAQDHSEMYQKILHDKLRLPMNIRGVVKDFISKMLERNPDKRLGGAKRGAEEIKRHPFFDGIDWGMVLRCEYEPPFKPKVDGTLDFRNIDASFSAAPISRSLRREAGEAVTMLGSRLGVSNNNDPDWEEFEENFAGFSFHQGNMLSP